MYRLSTAVAVLLTVLFSTPVLAFDNKPGKIDVDSTELGYSYVSINTFGSALGVALVLDRESDPQRVYYVRRKTSFILQGVGFVIKEGYIVTAAHVVHPTEVTTTGQPFSYTLFKPIRVLKRHIVVSPGTRIGEPGGGIPVELYHLDVENDIAILKYGKDAHNILKPIPFKMAYTKSSESGVNYDLIEPGVVIATVVRKRDEDGECEWAFEVRNAKVTSNKIYDVVVIEAMVEYNMLDFTADILVYSGDSGSPAFAFDLGEPVVVGIIRATYTGGPYRAAPDVPITTIVRIDNIKLFLDAE